MGTLRLIDAAIRPLQWAPFINSRTVVVSRAAGLRVAAFAVTSLPMEALNAETMRRLVGTKTRLAALGRPINSMTYTVTVADAAVACATVVDGLTTPFSKRPVVAAVAVQPVRLLDLSAPRHSGLPFAVTDIIDTAKGRRRPAVVEAGTRQTVAIVTVGVAKIWRFSVVVALTVVYRPRPICRQRVAARQGVTIAFTSTRFTTALNERYAILCAASDTL